MSLREETTTQFVPGDVLRYAPTGGTHCRQCTAVVGENGCAVDTYWGVARYSDGHVLSAQELETAELLFRLGDFRKLGEHWDDKHDEWMTYAPADRQRIGSQNQYQSTYYVRVGAEPDLETQITNARDSVELAEGNVRIAESRLQWRRQELAELEAKRGV
jgi:hypothetical protein